MSVGDPGQEAGDPGSDLLKKYSPTTQSEARQWFYGVNGYCDELPPEQVKAFQATGSLRADAAELCRSCKVFPHPVYQKDAAGKSEAGDADEGPNFVLRSILLDRVAVHALKVVLPTSVHLEVLRFSGCCLDADLLGLLRAGLSDLCTVTTLHLEWNPVELPIDRERLQTCVAEGNLEEVDKLEAERWQRQAGRSLRAFGDMLEARFGSLDKAIATLAAAAVPEFPATAALQPLGAEAWSNAFSEVLRLPTEEADAIFRLLEGRSRSNDNLLPMSQLGSSAQFQSSGTDDPDPIAEAFASFADATSPLELLSFRCCKLGRLEASAIGNALRENKHLRALNLWGNDIGDSAMEALGNAFETNRGLQYLGLGKNIVTHRGLALLCTFLDTARLTNKKEADAISKQISQALKQEAAAQKKKGQKEPTAPAMDANGRERYTAASPVDSIEERQDSAGRPYWLWTRNSTLQTISLECNPISDAKTVLQVRATGAGGRLVLRDVPCARELAALLAAGQDAGGQADEGEADAASAGGLPAEDDLPGWSLVL